MSITSSHLMSQYYTKTRLNHNIMYTVDYTSGYRSKKFICECMKSSAHAHCAEFRSGNFKHFKTSVECAK